MTPHPLSREAEEYGKHWRRMQGEGQVTYNNVTLEMRAEDRVSGFLAGESSMLAAVLTLLRGEESRAKNPTSMERPGEIFHCDAWADFIEKTFQRKVT